MTMSINAINAMINTIFNSKMRVHETYFNKGWTKGLIKAQYVQICQWDNISHWGTILQAAETLLAVDDKCKPSVYESFTDHINTVVGAIENPHDITMTVSNDGSVVQLAVRYQYSWL